MIIGIVTKTGVGLKLASALVDVAAGNFMLLLFCTMITSLILGMGRAYDGKLCHYIHYCGTGLIQLGVPILAAHMFVFYFASLPILLRLWRWRLMREALFPAGDPLKTGVNASEAGHCGFHYSLRLRFVTADFRD